MQSTQTRLGASREEWDCFANLGLTADLLPTVCDATAEPSAGTKIPSPGKVPTMLNAAGQFHGISNWTQLQATSKQVQTWREVPDYGICLQTRFVRAFDIDVDDPVRAASIILNIEEHLGACAKRTRPGTGRALIPFILKGALPKHILPVVGGILEVLADGNQFVAAGTHLKSGTRYEWTPGLPTEFPTITAEQLDAILADIYMFYGTEPVAVAAGARQKGADIVMEDPVAEYLREKGLVLGENRSGALEVACPWQNEHTDGLAGGSVYFPAGMNGYTYGGFNCMHAHCNGRSTASFARNVGFIDPGDTPEADFGRFSDEPASSPPAAAAPSESAAVESPPKKQRQTVATTSSTSRSVMLINGADVVPEAPRWLWDGWLARGKLHLLAGAPGQGKTTIALSLAAIVSSGGKWPDGTRCEAADVLMWSGEDDVNDTLVPRLIAAGANLKRIFFVGCTREGNETLSFDPARDLPDLQNALAGTRNVKLLIVDPVVSAVTGDSHKNTEVRRSLQPIVDLGAALDCAVLGISHFSKGTAGRDPTERVTGSIAFGAVARIVMVAGKVKGADGEDRRVFARSKSNIGADDGGFEYDIEQLLGLPGYPAVPASRIVWGHELSGTAIELLADAKSSAEGSEERTRQEEAQDHLKRLLNDGPLSSGEAKKLMLAAGFTDKTTRTAKERLNVISSRSGSGTAAKSTWALPSSMYQNRAAAAYAAEASAGAEIDDDPFA